MGKRRIEPTVDQGDGVDQRSESGVVGGASRRMDRISEIQLGWLEQAAHLGPSNEAAMIPIGRRRIAEVQRLLMWAGLARIDYGWPMRGVGCGWVVQMVREGEDSCLGVGACFPMTLW